MSQNTTGKKKALVIAVSDYTDKTINQLPFCKNDGERIYSLLRKTGFEISENSKLIGQVKWETMRDTLTDFFTQESTNSKDTLLFYFSGHGLVHNDKFYFATSEIDPNQPYRRGVDEVFIKDIIDDSPSRKIVMILDSCHAGKLNLFSKGDTQSAASVATDTIKKMNMAEGRFLLASCRGYQESFGTEDGSKFTQYVIDGLKGHKDSVDMNGFVTPDSLARYVELEMGNSLVSGQQQRPIKKVDGSGDIILAIYDEFRQKLAGDLDQGTLQKLLENAAKKGALEAQTMTGAATDSGINELLVKASNLKENGKYNEATTYYDKALEIAPENTDALNGKGELLNATGNYNSALAYFDKVLQINPNDITAVCGKQTATALAKIGDISAPFNDALKSMDASVFQDKASETDSKNLASNDKESGTEKSHKFSIFKKKRN